MAKKIKLNPMQVKGSRIYTVIDLAKVFDVNPRTISRWVKDGLPIFKAARPYLIMGTDVQIFLRERNRQRAIPCSDDQIICMRCKEAVYPISESIKFVSNTALTFYIKAQCRCGARLNKIASMKKRNEIFQDLPISQRRLKD